MAARYLLYDKREAKATEESKKNAAHIKWDQEHTKQIKLKLNLNTDADILEELDRQPSKMGYIKKLIREDIAKRQK